MKIWKTRKSKQESVAEQKLDCNAQEVDAAKRLATLDFLIKRDQ
jgi:hypothetical protein